MSEDDKIDQTKLRSITSGWYGPQKMGGRYGKVAHWLEEDDFRSNGGVMNHETIESISKRRKPFTVDYMWFWLES